MNQATNERAGWERAMGMCGYLGSPAVRKDRATDMKIGGRLRWRVAPKELVGTITKIEIDRDGDPWFRLTFDGEHKDVRVERSEVAPLTRA